MPPQHQDADLHHYYIATNHAAAAAAGLLNIERDLQHALSPFYASGQASPLSEGIAHDRKKGLTGLHFCSTPAAAAAVLKAFPGYKLTDRDGNEIVLPKQSILKKTAGPAP